MPPFISRATSSPAVPPPALEASSSSSKPGAGEGSGRFALLRGAAMRYSAAHFRADFIAGLTTALFTVPQSMAYALIAGFPPAAGISTAVTASVLGAAFGSSEYLINGPTNALSVMLASNAALFATRGDPVQSMVLLTLLAGLVQLVAGLARVGSLTRFVSDPVLTGFTAGAGVYIVINQLPAFLGIRRSEIPEHLWGLTSAKCALFDLLRLSQVFHGVRPLTAGLALLTLLTLRRLQRMERHLGYRLPAALLAVALVTLIVWAFGLDHLDALHRVQVVRDIEPLKRLLPRIRFPRFDLSAVPPLIATASAIGLMGAVEAIAVGKALAVRVGHTFDASRQLVGEGLCNLGAALVGGFASSGSFTRTAVNYEAGAVTRLSCILSGLLTLLLVLAFAPAANAIPVAALAGTLVHIGIKLVDVARLRAVYATTIGDRAVLLVTFSAVLLAEHLENALLLGVAASVYNALRRAEGFKLNVLAEGDDGSLREPPTREAAMPTEVTVLNLQGELFFAAAEDLQVELLRLLRARARFIVLRLHEAYNMDATTAAAIAQVANEARRRGGRLLLCGVRPGMYGTFERAGLLPQIGCDAVFPAEPEVLASTRHAVKYAHELAAAAPISWLS